MLEVRFPKVAELLADAEADVTAYAAFPRAHHRKIASTNPLGRVHKEIKRRSNVVGIFPDDTSVIRLVHDDWVTADRRYLSHASMRLIDHPTERRSTPATTPSSPRPNIRGAAEVTPTSTSQQDAADAVAAKRRVRMTMREYGLPGPYIP